MTKNRGRGLFATKDIKKGEIIIVEKPIAWIIENSNPSNTEDAKSEMLKPLTTLVKKCLDINKINGIQSMRMSYLCCN